MANLSPLDLTLEPLTARPPSEGGTGPGERAARSTGGQEEARTASLQTRSNLYLALCRMGDTVAAVGLLLGVFFLTNIGRMPHGIQEFLSLRLTVKNLLLLLAFGMCWRLASGLLGLYDSRMIRNRRAEATRVLAVVSLGSSVAMVFPLISVSGAFGFATVFFFWIGTSTALLVMRHAVRSLLTSDSASTSSAIIVGSGPRALRLYTQLRDDPSVRLIGFVDSADCRLPDHVALPWLGPVSSLEQVLMRQPVDEVLVALPAKSCYSEIQEAIGLCERLGVRARYLADVFNHGRAAPRNEAGEPVALVSLAAAPDDYRLAIKRALDIVGATVGLVLLAPVFLAAAIAVRLSDPGPIIYKQARYGYKRRVFSMYKFRTMVPEAEALQATLEDQNEADGPIFKIWDDPRITRVGRFLRRTSIDELPQLWNVLRGDMSLVGPRPMSMRDVHRFTEAELMRRFSFWPGITGLWQISGRSNLTFKQWIKLDLEYIDQWSLVLDFRILARTLPAVVRGTGAA